MQTANGRLKLSLMGDIPKEGITPAEALIYRKIHGLNAGGECLIGLERGEDVNRTDGEELERLCNMFGTARVRGNDKIQGFYPGMSPVLPKTFEEIGVRVKGGEKTEKEVAPPKPVVEAVKK